MKLKPLQKFIAAHISPSATKTWLTLVCSALLLFSLTAAATEKRFPAAFIGDLRVDTLRPESYQFSAQAFHAYRQVIDSIVMKSKSEGHALLVDKYLFKLIVYKNGGVLWEFPVELGSNPYDDKTKQGDGCTPEGLYTGVRKADSRATYYKAFDLNYPNSRDKKAGKTGGAIQLHGEGSGLPGNQGGKNWTAGCVAVSNKAMDSIVSTVHSPVAIAIIKYGYGALPDSSAKVIVNVPDERVRKLYSGEQ